MTNKEIIRLLYNENPYGCSPMVKEFIRTIDSSMIANYPDTNLDLIAAISKNYGIQQDMVLLENGVHALINNTMRAFLEPGYHVLSHEHAYIKFKSSVEKMSYGEYRSAEENHFMVDVDKMIEAINEKTKIIVLVNPCNPTGTFIPKSQVKRLQDNVPDGAIFIVDEVYTHFAEHDATDQGYENSLSLLKKNTIIFRTFSKVYGLAGLRLGYALCGSAELKNKIEDQKVDFEVNALAQATALIALQDKEHVNKTLELNKIAKDYFIKELRLLDIELDIIPSATNFVLIGFPDHNTAVKYVNFLKDNGFLIRRFNIPKYVRISIGTKKQMEKLILITKEFILK